MARHRCDKATFAELDALNILGYEILGLGPVHELIKPLHEQDRAFASGDGNRARDPLATRAVTQQLSERMQRLGEHGLLRRRLDLKLDVGRALSPAMRHLTLGTTISSDSRSSRGWARMSAGGR
jgi:hypothetical protein